RAPAGSPATIGTAKISTRPRVTTQTAVARSSSTGVLPPTIRSRPWASNSAGRLPSSAASGRSALDEPGVGSIRIHLELVVRAALHDLAPLHHDDLVGVADRAEPVGDDKARAAAPAQAVVDELLGRR